MSQESLWSRMLLQKYGTTSVYAGNALRANSSKLWRTLYPHFQILSMMSHWQVGKGDISFWRSKWCGEILNPDMDDECTVREGIQSLHSFTQVLIEEQKEIISLVELDPNEDDKLILSTSPSGSFSIARYIEANRVASPKVG